MIEKGSGVLLPIFSLPSDYGIGTFGNKAKTFIKYLAKAKVKYWQILPLNPTSYGDSPYQSFSAFALNPYFIDLDMLIKDGSLTKEDVECLKVKYQEKIDYGWIYENRFKVLRKAYDNTKDKLMDKIKKFEAKNKSWIIDFGIFMIIKNHFNGASYLEWPDKQLLLHKKDAINKFKEEHLDDYYFQIYLQYVASEQYKKLKRFANRNNIKIIGDIPIYVALDSADTWGSPKEFLLDRSRRPELVAGVPPDGFNADGQLWGNPLYDYAHMKDNNYKWWKKRIKQNKKLFDVLRIDHFRGMSSYYTIKFGETTARNGSWVEGPGMDLVNAINEAANGMEIIAEDLGYMDDKVKQLKKDSGWPGLKIVEFGYDAQNMDDDHLPKNYTNDTVSYIGTHDNDTLQGYLDANHDKYPFIKSVLNISDDNQIFEKTMYSLFNSNSVVVIATMQDILHQDGKSRINVPGTLGTNWLYRLPKHYDKNVEAFNFLSDLVSKSNR